MKYEDSWKVGVGGCIAGGLLCVAVLVVVAFVVLHFLSKVW